MKKPFEISEPRVTKPVEVAPRSDVTFISAGIKAAQNSQTEVRDMVLEDVSQALACAPKDLEFLFSPTDDDDNEVYDFPDSERRRKVISYNNLDAAE